MAGIPFSVLDLAPIVEGGSEGTGADAGAAEALRNTLELARHAEALGYERYWLAEHHNMTGIASAATVVVMGHVAGGTVRIRVGSGGIMLPNHSPLIVAEQFGTLETLFPGRIDLGLGRAPGTDMTTSRALRRDLHSRAEEFPQDVMELQAYFEPAVAGQAVRAVPGAGLRVPLWILGSSLYGAQVAAALGLPYAFASHFAPDALMPALQVYRSRFQPSRQLQRPHVMVAANVIAADSDEQARYLFTSLQQAFLKLRRGEPGPLPRPVADLGSVALPEELAGIDHALRYSYVGAPDTIAAGLKEFLAATGADELIISGHIHDHRARLRSFELAAGVREKLARAT
ncbi:MAG TPA: LLM class flavin-dependent oxidoreductase [Steroidobacteraceae bacterium]|nr:LLM class flavin-dependent oxidoreductase [Steroidobacteraceae bacterium]